MINISKGISEKPLMKNLIAVSAACTRKTIFSEKFNFRQFLTHILFTNFHLNYIYFFIFT